MQEVVSLANGYPCRAKMGAIRDGNPTSINKWELKKAGTLPRKVGYKGCVHHSLFYIYYVDMKYICFLGTCKFFHRNFEKWVDKSKQVCYNISVRETLTEKFTSENNVRLPQATNKCSVR